jgi:hypothetical protein
MNPASQVASVALTPAIQAPAPALPVLSASAIAPSVPPLVSPAANQTVEPAKVSTAPAAASAPASLDDDFFASTAPAADDIFAAHDAASASAIDLGSLMKEAPAPMRTRQPTKAEMQALRQEFSVVARLEKHNRKRRMYVIVGAVALVATIVVVVLFARRDVEYTGRGTSAATTTEVERPLYEVPANTAPTETGTETEVAAIDPEAAGGAEKAGAANARTGTQKTSAGSAKATKPLTNGAEKGTSTAMTAERFAELTRDEVGKSEVKLDFDSAEAARKAAAEAEERKANQATDLAAEVVAAFAKKKSQFARCSNDREEKLRVVFTVGTTGKVSGVQVEGAGSDVKRGCVRDILERSIFPSGTEPQTYGQVLTL